ncbi:Nitroreductase [Desulfovibrionales bacterium]
MQKNSGPFIDPEYCVGCGICLPLCPTQNLSTMEGRAMAGNNCIACGHCQAACPVEAISLQALDPTATTFSTFIADNRWLPYGQFDLPGLVQLMRSRRSCRTYSTEPVAAVDLEDLAKIGASAPSGTNSQHWTFTLLAARLDVERLGNAVFSFFCRLNRQAKNRFLCRVLKFVGYNDLYHYRHTYYSTVAAILEAYTRQGEDRLFYRAPAAILVGSRPGASCPAEDALLATQNILLAAHAMGLGTCCIGYAVSAMQHDSIIQTIIGIPADEAIHSVITIGYPTEFYCRSAGRRSVLLRWAR